MVFVLSGYVKAVDPMGMAYKLDAYLEHLELVLPSASFVVVFAIALSAFEFLIGIYLLLGSRTRFTLSCALVFMLCMTALTVYIYIYNPVADCGCFGDAIVLTNGETLGKNIALLFMLFWLLWFGRQPRRFISERNQWLSSVYSLIFIIVVCFYSIRFLPPVDFLPYKVGTHLGEAMMGEYSTVLVYEKEGERREFESENLPDSTWIFVAAETKAVVKPEIPNFQLLDGEEDVTLDILADTVPTFLLTIPDVLNADDGCSDEINDMVDYCTDAGYRFYAVVPSEQRKTFEEWTDRTGATYKALLSSRDDLRSMVRSNPGLMLLKEGVVIEKWSNLNLPYFDDETLHFDVLHPGVIAKQTFIGIVLGSFLWFVLPLLLLIIIDKLWMRKLMKKLNIGPEAQGGQGVSDMNDNNPR